MAVDDSGSEAIVVATVDALLVDVEVMTVLLADVPALSRDVAPLTAKIREKRWRNLIV